MRIERLRTKAIDALFDNTIITKDMLKVRVVQTLLSMLSIIHKVGITVILQIFD